MPTSHRRIQVLRDEALERALTHAAPHLEEGISASRAVHDLALVGAQHVAEGHTRDDEEREAALQWLVAVSTREQPAIDWEAFARLDEEAWGGR
ncbi:MAG: hypothetical protein MSC31_05560 [Solirubrobacteraceae bacterium MAG38_C4-C5]|nr:hypothetical protein [Candidatus Siliceabacter maunaloa]